MYIYSFFVLFPPSHFPLRSSFTFVSLESISEGEERWSHSLNENTLFFSEWELQIEREKIMNDTIAACFNVRVWGEDRWREGRG